MKPDQNMARLFWMDTVRVVKFELVLANGETKVVEFHRREKVRELLGAQDPIGDFLLAIASSREGE